MNVTEKDHFEEPLTVSKQGHIGANATSLGPVSDILT